ncbi:MAG: tRNA (guanosine(46)-N7)-methyltransferase TrmB [Chlamydiae bacterium]|nr:tRNA (guanosine(46)-N7)-methyltransferase TrmB [Chlamydiota bacterium]
MKQQDLLYPYTFDERRPLLEDQVFFIPKNYPNHSAWEGSLLPNNRAIHVEFCSGNGEWIIQKATEEPDVFWVAVERKFDRVRKIWVKAKQKGLTNILIVCGEAETFAEFYLKPQTVCHIFINFPDPWPKLRHAKNRLMQKTFAELVVRALKTGGLFTFVTDDTPYRHQTEKLIKEETDLISTQDVLEDYGSSYFHRLWLEKGKEIHFLRFRKQ